MMKYGLVLMVFVMAVQVVTGIVLPQKYTGRQSFFSPGTGSGSSDGGETADTTESEDSNAPSFGFSPDSSDPTGFGEIAFPATETGGFDRFEFGSGLPFVGSEDNGDSGSEGGDVGFNQFNMDNRFGLVQVDPSAGSIDFDFGGSTTGTFGSGAGGGGDSRAAVGSGPGVQTGTGTDAGSGTGEISSDQADTFENTVNSPN